METKNTQSSQIIERKIKMLEKIKTKTKESKENKMEEGRKNKMEEGRKNKTEDKQNNKNGVGRKNNVDDNEEIQVKHEKGKHKIHELFISFFF